MNAPVRPNPTAAEAGFADLFAAAGPGLPGGRAVSAFRQEAFGRFAATGLPHSRVEDWKYTDLRRLMSDAKPLACAPVAPAPPAILAGLDCRRIVVVDGVLSVPLSDLANLEAGLSVRSAGEALDADEPLLAPRATDAAAALNAAFAADGVDIAIAAGAVIERPIHLAFVASTGVPSAIFTRSRIVVGDGARATIVESCEGLNGSDYQVNAAMDLAIGDRAQVDHVRIGGEGDKALHLSTQSVSLGREAVLRQFALGFGGAVVRDRLGLDIVGESAAFEYLEASLSAGTRHADTTLAVRHIAPGAKSRELFKAVVADRARAVFQGKITVEPGAQQTDGRMMARALLLSDEATANCKPELEIFADDVQCGHGATTGGLDEQLRFYLMARGIPAAEADALLIQAFVGDVFDAVGRDDLRAALTGIASDWLKRQR